MSKSSRVVRVELEELALVGLGREVLARQLLRADHEALELGLVLGVLVVGQLADDQADHERRDRAADDDDRQHLERRAASRAATGPAGASRSVSATARQSTVVKAIRRPVGQRESMRPRLPEADRAITRRWISFVPS